MFAPTTAGLLGVGAIEFKTARQLEHRYVRNFIAALVAKDLCKKQNVLENFSGG